MGASVRAGRTCGGPSPLLPAERVAALVWHWLAGRLCLPPDDLQEINLNSVQNQLRCTPFLQAERRRGERDRRRWAGRGVGRKRRPRVGMCLQCIQLENAGSSVGAIALHPITPPPGCSCQSAGASRSSAPTPRPPGARATRRPCARGPPRRRASEREGEGGGRGTVLVGMRCQHITGPGTDRNTLKKSPPSPPTHLHVQLRLPALGGGHVVGEGVLAEEDAGPRGRRGAQDLEDLGRVLVAPVVEDELHKVAVDIQMRR